MFECNVLSHTGFTKPTIIVIKGIPIGLAPTPDDCVAIDNGDKSFAYTIRSVNMTIRGTTRRLGAGFTEQEFELWKHNGNCLREKIDVRSVARMLDGLLMLYPEAEEEIYYVITVVPK